MFEQDILFSVWKMKIMLREVGNERYKKVQFQTELFACKDGGINNLDIFAFSLYIIVVG